MVNGVHIPGFLAIVMALLGGEGVTDRAISMGLRSGMYRILASVLILLLFINSAVASGNLEKLAGWGALSELAQGKIVLFGDVHSKNGPADTMESYLRYLSTTNQSVLVGIEIAASEQARLDAFMNSDGSDLALSALLTGSPFWEHPGANDGRPNAAWLNVIKTARDMRTNGQKVSLIAIIHFKAGMNWDGPSAKIFRDAMKTGKFDTAVILAGNAHTMQSDILLNSDRPFAFYLGSQNVISLNANYADAIFEFSTPVCSKDTGKVLDVFLRSDIFAPDDTHKYDGVFCAPMRRSPNASPRTEAAYKKRLGRD